MPCERSRWEKSSDSSMLRRSEAIQDIVQFINGSRNVDKKSTLSCYINAQSQWSIKWHWGRLREVGPAHKRYSLDIVDWLKWLQIQVQYSWIDSEQGIGVRETIKFF